MAAPYTLAQLLSAQSADQIRARHLALLGADPFPGLAGNLNHGFPVADWLSNPKGMELAYANMFSRGLYDLVASQIPADVASGFLAKAKGDLLTAHASLFYKVERNPATKTVFNLSIKSVVSAPPYDFDVGDIQVRGASGNIYVSRTAKHLDAGGTITMDFEAEAAGSQATDDPTIKPPTLVSAFAGVSVSAGVGDFSPVVHQGDGTGHVEFKHISDTAALIAGVPPSSPVTPGVYRVRIEVSGDPTTATYSLAIDAGAFVFQGLLNTINNFPANFVTIKAMAGSGSPASFLSGDIYTTTSPGGSGYIQGADIESDLSLADRCRARWPSISLNPTRDVFVLWTKLAAPSATRVSVQADPLVPGRTQIVAADSHAGIDAVSLNAISAYITPRLGSVLESISVAPAVNRQIVTFASVYVTALTVVAVQAAIRTAWTAYLSTVPIGGVVYLSELEQLIMDAGAVDVTALLLNGVFQNVSLGRDQVPVAVDIVAELLWVYT